MPNRCRNCHAPTRNDRAICSNKECMRLTTGWQNRAILRVSKEEFRGQQMGSWDEDYQGRVL